MSDVQRTSIEVLTEHLERFFEKKVTSHKEGEKIDTSAVALLPVILEEVRRASYKGRAGEATFGAVAEATVAIELWNKISEDNTKFFSQTRFVLWSKIVDGWLSDSIGLSLSEEEVFARFISEVKLFNTETEKMLDYIRKEFDSIPATSARQKVARFLKGAREYDDSKTIQTVARMLGRYIRRSELVIFGSVLEALQDTYKYGRTIELAAPCIATYTSLFIDLGVLGNNIYHGVNGPPSNFQMKLEGRQVTFSWEIERDEDRSFLIKQGETIVHDWREKFPEHKHIEVLLDCNVLGKKSTPHIVF